MDIFATLEERVEKLITGYKELQARVAALEEENRKLQAGDEGTAHLTERIVELEAERNEIRARLEKLLKNVAALEL
ncbi:MAG TPA: cell division protein ZapB [Thermoanaerobaculaceae bacterium]|jgi:FtsZ-binding cell division protein ZapB|nr:cell division protein ZapB [Thermoanaerobaculaceae bacterium]